MAAANHHIAFNPLEKFEPAEPKYEITAIKTMNSLTDSIKYTSQLTPGEATLNGVYRDPWVLLIPFPHIDVSGVFTNTGCISGNFTSETNRKSMMIQYHVQDRGAGAQHVDETLLGGKVVKYSWKVSNGQALREEADIKCASFATGNIKAMTGTATVHDGLFSEWSTTGIIHAKDITITFAGVAIPTLQIRELDFGLQFENPQDHVMSSLVADVEYDGNRKYTCSVKGFLTGTTQLNQIKTAYEQRTYGTIKVQADYNGSSGVQALQFTNAYFKECDNYAINPAAEAYEVSFLIEDSTGSEASFIGAFSGAVLVNCTKFVSGNYNAVLPR